MQRLEVSGAVRPLQWSLGVKGIMDEDEHILLPVLPIIASSN